MRENRGLCSGKLHLAIYRTKKPNAVSKIFSWRRLLKRLCFGKLNPGYNRVGLGPDEAKHAGVPKGHLPVYVGERDDETCMYMVPVIYFNHPLFGKLLREAEKEFGYDYPGGIQIPCRVSEFEMVKRKIDRAK